MKQETQVGTHFDTENHLYTKLIKPKKGLVIGHGAAGSGKGTLLGRAAEVMTNKYGIHTVHFASGDALREEQEKNYNGPDPIQQEMGDIGRLAKRYMDAGELVPVEPMTRLIALRLQLIQSELDPDEILLDGFPRSIEQETELRKMIGDYARRDILIDASRATCVQRAKGRKRTDDTDSAIARRMGSFYDKSNEGEGILHMVHNVVLGMHTGELNTQYLRIDGEQDPDAVFNAALPFIIATSPARAANTNGAAAYAKANGYHSTHGIIH